MSLAIRDVVALTGELQRNYLFKTVIESYPESLLSAYTNAKPVVDGFDCVSMKGIWPDRTAANIKLEWGGEFVNFTGVDESKKDGEIEAIIDQGCKVVDFFDACKDLTGNYYNNTAAPRNTSRLTLGTYLISTDKQTVVDYRKLLYVKIDSVNTTPLEKNGKDLLKLKVKLTWDFIEKDNSKRGKTI